MHCRRYHFVPDYLSQTPRHSGSIRMLSRITLVSFFLLICAPVFAGPKEQMVSNALQGEELSELQAQEEMF